MRKKEEVNKYYEIRKNGTKEQLQRGQMHRQDRKTEFFGLGFDIPLSQDHLVGSECPCLHLGKCEQVKEV